MDWIPQIFRRRKFYEDLSEEIRLHIEERTEQLMSDGMSAEEATRAARRAFGNRTLLEERSREVWQWPTLESIWADVRVALRQLRKSPGFTITAVLTLTLAIGANAVVFGVLNALILRPLNVPQAENLFVIQPGERHSYPDYLDLRQRNRSFDDVAVFAIRQSGLDTGKDPSKVWQYETSGNYFDVLRIQPYLGRFFHASDEHGPNSAPYVVLSYGYWHSHFQDDRTVVGRVVRLNRQAFTILGVAPPGFQGTILFFAPDIFLPMVNHEQLTGEELLNGRGTHWMFEMVGRLKPGGTPAQATGDLNSVDSYLKKTYPKEEDNEPYTLARPGLHGDYLGGATRAFLTGLMLLSGLILLAACANLGSLFAARAADRSREVALRLALGSSRNRILRQLFTESILLSLAGGFAGLMGSIVLLRWLSMWQPVPQFPLHVPVSPDANVYLVAMVLALVSGVLFGVVPVRQILRANPYEIVKSGSTGAFGHRITARDILLVVQIAICAVLVTSSMVALRGLMRSMHSNFGFDPQNVMLVDTDLTTAGYSGDRIPAMQRRMIEALQAIPGADSVGSVNWPPLELPNGGWQGKVYTDTTTDLSPSNAAADPHMYNVSPDYFRASGTSILAGRAFTWHDDTNAPRVAVVNREFASKILGSIPDAVGRYFKLRDGTRVRVVGLVEDGKYGNLTEEQQPAMFLPLLQSPASWIWLVVRSNRDPQQLAAAVRSVFRDIDPGMVLAIRPWSEELGGTLFPSRMATVSLGVLGMMGAMLSITGIFGMAAYSVSKRLKELGIRVALGAQRKEVLQAALGRAFKLLAIGSGVGLILGLLATKVLAFIVYQATPRDPMVMAGVVLAMAALGLLATWIPAQRALSVNPLILLRED
jgi:macrolide transport system ATP-binding/permease protein